MKNQIIYRLHVDVAFKYRGFLSAPKLAETWLPWLHTVNAVIIADGYFNFWWTFLQEALLGACFVV